MSLRIVIDGYNLLHVSLNLQLLAAKDLEAARNRLLNRLEQYRALSHHRLTVVFDGWRSGAPMESHDRLGQVDIIYSRLGEKADEVIKRLAQTGQGAMVVVTSDRELADFVRGCGATVIPSAQFDARLRTKSQAVAEAPPDKDEDYPSAPAKKKGTAYRLSRKDRRLKSTLQKL